MTAAGHKRLLAIGVTAAVVALSVAWLIVRPIRTYRITTGSMEPALPIGSKVVVRTTKDVHVGDSMAFRFPIDPRIEQIKRIVAGPGDEVAIKDKKLIVNGREVDEPYVIHSDPVMYPSQPAMPEPYRSRDQYGPYRVPADSFFVLGDNRDRSSDSRYWGAVPRDLVIGRVIYVSKR